MKNLFRENEIELRDILNDLEAELLFPEDNIDYKEKLMFVAKELKDYCRKYNIKDREEQFEELGEE